MSADNRICLMQDEDGSWAVWMGSLSYEYHTPPLSAERFTEKDKAMTKAVAMAKEAVVLEGGIEEISSQEQAQALAMEIEDCAIRLRNLQRTGCQWERNFN